MNVFSQNIFWVNCFFIKFWFSWRKLWNPGKKTCQGCYTFLLRVQRNDQWKELFSRKIYTTPSFGSRALKKFNSRRRSFTNVVSVPFNVFSGKFSGKQVVLEKHTNFHQFWILKQISIETSQKNLKTMSTLTFTCRVERSTRKKFFIVFETFRFFLNCCWSLTEKNWKFLRKRHGRVAKTALYVSRGTSFGKTIFFVKIVLFSIFDCRGEDCDSCKRF